jgi:hypothetical protein
VVSSRHRGVEEFGSREGDTCLRNDESVLAAEHTYRGRGVEAMYDGTYTDGRYGMDLGGRRHCSSVSLLLDAT